MDDSFVQSDSILANRVAYLVNETEETCQWVTYLMAQLMVRLRQSRPFQHTMLENLDIALNPVDRPEFLGPVIMTSFSLGEGYPRFFNAKVVSKTVGTFERHVS